MEANRLALREKLIDVMECCDEDPHLYFQPEASVTMRYPCIVYHLKTLNTKPADDRKYHNSISFDVTYITRSPASKVPTKILELQFMVFDRYYTAENLHHYAYTYTDTLKEV